MELSSELCRRIAQDAANLQMRGNGRTQWNEDDYNHAARTFNDLEERRARLFPAEGSVAA